MDANELGAARAVVGELVRRPGRDDHDVSSGCIKFLVAGVEGEVSFEDDPRLVVGVAVQPGAVTGIPLVEDERNTGAVAFAFEVAGWKGAVSQRDDFPDILRHGPRSAGETFG
jgi:hypothetical protein